MEAGDKNDFLNITSRSPDGIVRNLVFNREMPKENPSSKNLLKKICVISIKKQKRIASCMTLIHF